MNQFRMLRMGRVSKEPLNSVRTSYKSPQLPGKQPMVGTTCGQTTTISPSSPLLVFKAIALAPTKSTWKDDKIQPAISQSSNSACSKAQCTQLLQNIFSFSCTIPHYPRFVSQERNCISFIAKQCPIFFFFSLLYVHYGCGQHSNRH